MPITVFDDIILPPCTIAVGVSGRLKRQNARAQNQGGFGLVNVVWTTTLREFDIGFVAMLPLEWGLIEGLYEITDAGAYGLLMQDPKDSTASAADGVLVSLGGGLYQMYKTYRAKGTARTRLRKITRPMASASAPGTINTTNGTVTVAASATQGVSSYTVGASTIINFPNGIGVVASAVIGQQVTISGATGTGAAAINGNRTVTAKGATSVTVSVDTTGLSVAGGTAAVYAPALAWSGGFYVPVHFANDDLDWSLVRGGPAGQRLTAGQSIMLQEIRE